MLVFEKVRVRDRCARLAATRSVKVTVAAGVATVAGVLGRIFEITGGGDGNKPRLAFTKEASRDGETAAAVDVVVVAAGAEWETER